MFDTWMMQESDAVQASARSFAERLISERFNATIESSQESLKPILGKLYQLYLLTIVEKNLGYVFLKISKPVTQLHKRLFAEIVLM